MALNIVTAYSFMCRLTHSHDYTGLCYWQGGREYAYCKRCNGYVWTGGYIG